MAEQRRLVGQTCAMWGRPVRFTLSKRYHVFALDCEGGVQFRFEDAVRDYAIAQPMQIRLSIEGSLQLGLLVLPLALWAEVVHNRKKQAARAGGTGGTGGAG